MPIDPSRPVFHAARPRDGTFFPSWGYTFMNDAARTNNEGSDWQLVERARSGEMRAFTELVSRYQQPLIHFCGRMTGSFEDAQDIAQESFVRIYRHLHRLEPDAKFTTVLFGIARNLTLNFLRDSARRGRGRTASLTRDDATTRTLPALGQRPDQAAQSAEVERALQSALEQLTPDHREVLLLRELQGMDYETIARVLGCREGTVKSRIARAREQLREILARQRGELR